MVIIVVGVITLIVGFLGCCGAIRENHCMVMTVRVLYKTSLYTYCNSGDLWNVFFILQFAVLIGLILVMEIGAGIAAFVMKSSVEDTAESIMKKTMINYGEDGKGGVTSLWDKMQKDVRLNCRKPINIMPAM